MGKTKAGSKIYRAFIKRYGPVRGKRVFYAWATRHYNLTPGKKHHVLTGRSGRIASRGPRSIKRRRL